MMIYESSETQRLNNENPTSGGKKMKVEEEGNK